MAWRNLVWAMTAAMALDPEPGPGGSVIPRLEYAAAARLFATLAWPRVKEIFELLLGGSLVYTVSSYRDLQSEELGPVIERFYRGTGLPARERIKLFKLAWDAIGSEFGGRHELYERNYSGNHEQVRLDVVSFARQRGLMDRFIRLVDQCLGEYDVDGWKVPWWSWDADRADGRTAGSGRPANG